MKKKKSKKQASDFARELDELDAEGEEGNDGGEVEGDLGDDVFGTNAPVEGAVESGQEVWVIEGRDPTYQEVSYPLTSSTTKPMSDHHYISHHHLLSSIFAWYPLTYPAPIPLLLPPPHAQSRISR